MRNFYLSIIAAMGYKKRVGKTFQKVKMKLRNKFCNDVLTVLILLMLVGMGLAAPRPPGSKPLQTAFHYLPYQALVSLRPIREAETAVRLALATQRNAARMALALGDGDGMMQMLWGGSAMDCVTNGPVYL